MLRGNGTQHSQRGFAIVVVVLISAIALLSFLFASATLTLSSRSSVAQERASTQALLAADSGLRTLEARATESPYVSGTFKAWIEGSFGTLDLGDDIEAQLVVVDEAIAPLPGSVTVQSTGIAGTSRRVLIQSFVVRPGPPVPLSANVPGALTSVGTIKSNTAAARVVGRGNSEEEWSYQGVQLCTAAPGEYVVIGDDLYRVVDEMDCDGMPVKLESVPGDLEVNTFSGAHIVDQHRPFAITEALDLSDTNPVVSEVAVTDAALSLFGLGASITIGDDSSLGEITAIDGNVLTIKWEDDAAPIGTWGEGTIIRREVLSGVTQGDCDIGINGDTTFPDGCADDQNLSNLFVRTFGVTSEALKGSLPSEQLLTGAALRDGRIVSDVTWLSNPENNVRGQTGSGVIIIEADPGQTIRLNVDNNFIGLIYVIGNAFIAGNAQYAGAIIVDGAAEFDTSVQGTADILYDPLQVSRALANITVPSDTPGGIGLPIANTWRVR